jgi:DNA-binding LacI/PurR family transcriptional regulator
MEPDHKMDKRLKITEIAARTQLSISTVSRVLAGKANTSEKARAKVLACARELGVMDGMAAGRLLLNSLVVFAPQRAFDERSDIFYYRVIQSVSKAPPTRSGCATARWRRTTATPSCFWRG